MTIDQFRIGSRFYMSGEEWQCTDIGTRTVAAVQIEQHVRDDPSWLNGPPYALLEQVIDEFDMDACSLTPKSLID